MPPQRPPQADCRPVSGQGVLERRAHCSLPDRAEAVSHCCCVLRCVCWCLLQACMPAEVGAKPSTLAPARTDKTSRPVPAGNLVYA